MLTTEPGPLTSGAYARQTGLSRKALRLYERRGLLRPWQFDESTGYRYYRPDQLELGRLLQVLRDSNLPGSVQHRFAASYPDGDEAADWVKTYLYAEIGDMHRRQGRIHEALAALTRAVLPADSAVRLVSEPRHYALSVETSCTSSEVPMVMVAAQHELDRAVHAAPAEPSGVPYCRFLTPITERLAGRLEVNLPLGQALAPPVGMSVAHRPDQLHAVIDLPASDSQYPLIVGALEQLQQWLLRHGHNPAAQRPGLSLHDHTPGGRVSVRWGLPDAEASSPPPGPRDSGPVASTGTTTSSADPETS